MPSSAVFRAFVLIVVLAHAAAFWAAVRPTSVGAREKAGARQLQARMLPPVTRPPPAALVAEAPVPAAPAALAPPVIVPPPEKVAAAPAQPEPAPSSPDADPASPAATAPTSTASALASLDPDAEFQDYLPRSSLTVPPRPAGPIDVRFPDGVEGIVNLNIQVTLFIDEAGNVRRARVDNALVPPQFAQAVAETFLPARFKPGEVETVPVRSQVRVEIEFRAAR